MQAAFVLILFGNVKAFTLTSRSSQPIGIRPTSYLQAAEGGDKEWSKALRDSEGIEAGSFEKELKLKGLLKGNENTNPKLSENAKLLQWLEEKDIYLSEQSGWGDAPHPMAISTETKDEITNESSGRGLLARRDINEGDELVRIPMNYCFTKKAARKALGKDALDEGIN
jgi:hypothetical protein